MRTVSRSILVAVAAACLVGASATVASASPGYATRCLGACHPAGVDATIAASLASTSTTTATYDVTMSGAAGSAWAVFDGTTRLAGASSTTGSFTVDMGKTYTIFAVDGVAESCATTAVSPAAPVEEPTVSLDETMPPVTTSNAVASYIGGATIVLSASDGAGRGVSYIYYSIDGAPVRLFRVGMVAQTSFDVAAPIVGSATHSIEFWSQDNAGNVEKLNSASFTVAATPPPVVKTAAKLTTPVAPSSALHRTSFTVYGYLTPRHSAGSSVISLRFYRYKSGKYVYYKSLNVRVSDAAFDGYSKFTVKTSLPYAGKWRIRSVHADDLHLTSFSGYEYMTVR